jgi:general secretion pathway protein G
MRKLHSARSGFTLLEIMLVVTIIALLLGAGIYYMTGSAEYAREIRIKGDISSISTQLRLYQSMNGFLPSTEQGLKAMVVRPESEPKPGQWRQLMTQVPVDPWQSEYVYVQPGVHNTASFDIFSKGQDRQPNTADDLGNWDASKKP